MRVRIKWGPKRGSGSRPKPHPPAEPPVEQHVIDGEHHNHVMGWGGPDKLGRFHYFFRGSSLCNMHGLTPEVDGCYPEDELYLHTDLTRNNCRECVAALSYLCYWANTRRQILESKREGEGSPS